MRNRSGSKPLKRMQRTLARAPRNSLRRRSRRRLSNCLPWPPTPAITSPLRCSMPRNCCSSSRVIFCGGYSSSKRSFSSSRLIVAVQPVQQGVFLFLEAEVVQPHRVLDDPVAAPQVMLAARDQIGPPPDRQRACGTGKQTVVKGDHESGSVSSHCLRTRIPMADLSELQIVISACMPGLSSQEPLAVFAVLDLGADHVGVARIGERIHENDLAGKRSASRRG